MKNTILFLFFAIFLISPKLGLAQEDSTVNIVDEIQFDLKGVKQLKDTLQVDLYAISYEKNPRDFRLNVFATVLIDADGESHMLQSIQMDRVMILLSQRQNYLNYLLKQDLPAPIRIKFSPLTPAMKKAKSIKLVFESLEEEGRFMEVNIPI